MTDNKQLLLALSDAFACFNNESIGSMHNGAHDVACIASGMNAIAWRLEQLANEPIADAIDIPAPADGEQVGQVHVLKTLDLYFDAVKRGEKTFEVRLNDRAFQTGDILELRRIEAGRSYISDDNGRPIGTESLRKVVSYLLEGGQFGIEPQYCVLGLGDLPAPDHHLRVEVERLERRLADKDRALQSASDTASALGRDLTTVETQIAHLKAAERLIDDAKRNDVPSAEEWLRGMARMSHYPVDICQKMEELADLVEDYDNAVA